VLSASAKRAQPEARVVDRRASIRRLGVSDIGYIVARLLVAFSLILLRETGLLTLPQDPRIIGLFQWGLALFTLTGVLVLVEYLVFHLTTRQVLWSALPLDVVTGGMLLVATHMYQDPVYAWLVGIVVIYAAALSRRESNAVTIIFAVSYFADHVIGFGWAHSTVDYILLAFKAVALVLLGYFVSEGTHRQIEREAELENSRNDIESLNEQLQRRLAELSAVSEITDVVHSSLDFDAIGPLVLEIIQKVIDLPACSLLVLDKEKAETLFSASTGLGSLPLAIAGSLAFSEGPAAVELEGGLFSCLTILDHAHMMVVFCAAAGRIEAMRQEDRLVLQAVASELAVAVENSQLYKLTKRLSITDELTGLNNYRHLQQRLEDEYERARRFDRSLSLLMLDADDFKLFNDRYGHVAGDVALAELGGLLKAAVREIDVVARYGGEEFSVVLPETDAAGAFVVAEKIRESVATHRFPDADGNRVVSLTVSIGLATYPIHAADREDLLRQADDALYQAKHLGRDRVRTSQPIGRAAEPSAAAEGQPA
jgi:diguanylate cyclase (GGDEF)-like protein